MQNFNSFKKPRGFWLTAYFCIYCDKINFLALLQLSYWRFEAEARSIFGLVNTRRPQVGKFPNRRLYFCDHNFRDGLKKVWFCDLRMLWAWIPCVKVIYLAYFWWSKHLTTKPVMLSGLFFPLSLKIVIFVKVRNVLSYIFMLR